MLAAIRRASSLVMRLAAARRPEKTKAPAKLGAWPGEVGHVCAPYWVHLYSGLNAQRESNENPGEDAALHYIAITSV
jgi:hypothetical protein